jgi:hypothetical protein
MNKYERAVLVAAEARMQQLVRECGFRDAYEAALAKNLQRGLSKEAKALIRATAKWLTHRDRASV